MDYQAFAQKCKEGHTFTNVLTGWGAVSIKPDERTFSPEDEASIDALWNEKLASGQKMTNGSLAGIMQSWTRTISPAVLELTLYPTDFKHYICTKNAAGPVVWLTGPSAVTRLVDRNEKTYILGERKSKNLNTGGAIEFVPGGLLKAAHLYDADPFRSTLEEELEEETGIERRHIASMTPLWYGELVKFPDGRSCRNVCVDYLMDIKGVSQEQVQEGFASTSREHTQLFFVPEQELLSFGEQNYSRINTRGLCTFEQLIGQGTIS